MYCIICGNKAREGIICNEHKAVWDAIHDLANRIDIAIPQELISALVKTPYLYDRETGRKKS